MSEMEYINRATWSDPLSLRIYRRSRGHLNAGEQRAFETATDMAPGGAVLDIGIGGGRTSELLEGFADSYLGIDYTPEMVALARSNHPDKSFLLMDARNMAALENGSFDLALFSYNGIDSVDGEGRKAVLAEVARVLKPGGVFLFSSFHRNWVEFSNGVSYSPQLEWTANPVRLGLRLARAGYSYGRAMLRRRRYVRLQDLSGEHARLLHSAHDFGILVYATTPQQIDEQLAAAGFETPAILIDAKGSTIEAETEVSEIEFFNIIARKPSMQ